MAGDEEPKFFHTYFGTIKSYYLIEVVDGPRDGEFDIMFTLDTGEGQERNFMLPNTELDKLQEVIDLSRKHLAEEKKKFEDLKDI